MIAKLAQVASNISEQWRTFNAKLPNSGLVATTLIIQEYISLYSWKGLASSTSSVFPSNGITYAIELSHATTFY